MLIEDDKLNIKQFKDFFDSLDWVRVPRILTQDHQDYFYIGTYEDENKKVRINIRPSMYMKVVETTKNLTPEGKPPPPNRTTKLVNWSSSVEVLIDDSMLNKVKEVSKEAKQKKNQIVSWD